VLHTNQDWLLSGKGEAGAYVMLDGDQTELQAIWQVLPVEGKSALIAAARALRDAYVPGASASNPYPKNRSTRSA